MPLQDTDWGQLLTTERPEVTFTPDAPPAPRTGTADTRLLCPFPSAASPLPFVTRAKKLCGIGGWREGGSTEGQTRDLFEKSAR